MAHPKQRAMVALLAERIEALRKAKTDEALIALQEDLIDGMMAAQADQDAAKAQRVRVARQPHADPNEVHAAEIELVVADRIVRPLRAIGDAIAWRAARFHRKVFAVCAHEPGGGPVFGKAGWGPEVERAREIWERDGEIAIVNGITNCLRAADVTVFGKSGIRLEEVKSKAGSRRAGQRARWRELEAAINTGAPYATPDGQMQVWECGAQLRTRVKADLEPALREADRLGTSTRRLGQGWILIVTTREGYRQNQGRLNVEEIRRRRSDAITDAGMANVAHHLNLNTVDATSRAAWAAPFSVFPLSPTDCALLICDYAVYESRMAYDRFEDALRREGLSVQHYLTAENKTEPPTAFSRP